MGSRRDRIFNPQKRKVLRKKIPSGEIIFGAAFILILGLSTLWVAAQRDNFEAADRDISFETLRKDSVEDTLYKTPLKRWTEPGSPVAGATADLGPFSPALLDGGWELDGRVEVFNADNVYEKINGAADLYIAFGFRNLHYVTIARGDQFLNIELYDQGEFRNVLGIFSAQRSPDREILSEGDLFYYRTPVGVIGGYRNLYFKVAGNSESAAVLDKAIELVSVFRDLETGESRAPRPFRILTGGLGIPLDGLEYKRQDVFQFDFLDDFWFAASPVDPDAKYFIHEAADAESASRLFDRLVKEQEFEHTLRDQDEASVLFEHKFLGTLFALLRRDNLLYGVEGATDPVIAHDMILRLEGNLDE